MVFGVRSLERLGELAPELGCRRVLLVTDPGVARAGHARRAAEMLQAAGIAVELFDQVVENPTGSRVAACADFARPREIDGIVGIGGGSSLDTAKGCNFLLTNGGRIEDYWGSGKAPRPMLPMIAVPTTAGTGSEVQSFALISQDQTHIKMACGDPKAAPRVALLDPQLTLTQPAGVAAAAGIDVLAHAIEAAVTRTRNPISSMFAREAFRLAAAAFPKIIREPSDIEARGNMLMGAALAGLAIENSMLGAAHAAANPLTAHYGVVHGRAVGLMLPWVVRYNGVDPDCQSVYAELAVGPPLYDRSGPPQERIARFIERCLEMAAMPRSFSRLGIGRSALPMLADEAARQWTAGHNPRPIDRDGFLGLYDAVACNGHHPTEVPA